MIPKLNDRLCNGNGWQPHDPEKALTSQSEMNTMLITFFHIKDIVRFEFILHGETINQTYYVKILKPLLQAVKVKVKFSLCFD
jgi:hypothetical protein